MQEQGEHVERAELVEEGREAEQLVCEDDAARDHEEQNRQNKMVKVSVSV